MQTCDVVTCDVWPRNIVDKGDHRGGHDEAQQSLLVQLERSGNCEVPLDGHRHCEVGGADSATNKAKCPLDAVETPLSHCYTSYLECSTAIRINQLAFMQQPMRRLEFWWACEPVCLSACELLTWVKTGDANSSNKKTQIDLNDNLDNRSISVMFFRFLSLAWMRNTVAYLLTCASP